MIKSKLFLLLFLGGLLWSCQDNEPQYDHFVSSTWDQSVGFTTLQIGATQLFPDFVDEVEYNVDVYHFTYRTNYKGEEIEASGILGMPKVTEALELPILSIQRGTIIANSDAPSARIDDYSFLAAIATAGYITILPDLIGFGPTQDMVHPYFVQDATAAVVRDMILGAREYLPAKNVSHNGDVFLLGYSEGGFATMATQKLLEEEPISGTNLIAAASGAGAYDIEGMVQHFANASEYDQPFFLGFVLSAYEQEYDWSLQFSDFFAEPYATNAEGSFDGSVSSSDLNDLLSTDLAELLNPEFVENWETGTKYSEFREAVETNSLAHWAPTTPTYLYHGTDDEIVPFENSVRSIELLLAAGTSESTLTFFEIEEATHGSGFFPMLNSALPIFGEMK